MTFTKHQKFGAAIGLMILLLIIFIIYFVKKTSPPKVEMCPDGVTPIPSNGKCPTATPTAVKNASGVTTYVPAAPPKPDASGCYQPSSYVAYSFPLALGMSGSAVVQWQAAINSSNNAGLSTDGYFGCLTQAATNSAIGTNTVSQDAFNSATSGSTASTGYVQIPPIDANGCDADDNDKNGFPCASIGA